MPAASYVCSAPSRAGNWADLAVGAANRVDLSRATMLSRSRYRRRIGGDPAGPADATGRRASLLEHKARLRQSRAGSGDDVSGLRAMERLVQAAASHEDREMRQRARYLLSELAGIRQREGASAVEAHLVHAVRVVRELADLRRDLPAAPTPLLRSRTSQPKGNYSLLSSDGAGSEAWSPASGAAPASSPPSPPPRPPTGDPQPQSWGAPTALFGEYTAAAEESPSADSSPPLHMDVHEWSAPAQTHPPVGAALPANANAAYQRTLDGAAQTAAARLAREREVVRLCRCTGEAAAGALGGGVVAAAERGPSRVGQVLIQPASQGAECGAGDPVSAKAAGHIRRATAALERRGREGSLCAAPLAVVDWAGARWVAAAALPPAAARGEGEEAHASALIEAAAAANVALPEMGGGAGVHSGKDGRAYLVNPALAFPVDDGAEEKERGAEPATLLAPRGSEGAAGLALLRPHPDGLPAAVRRALGVDTSTPLVAHALEGDLAGTAVVGPATPDSSEQPNEAASRVVGAPLCGPHLVVGLPLYAPHAVLQLRPEVLPPSLSAVCFTHTCSHTRTHASPQLVASLDSPVPSDACPPAALRHLQRAVADLAAELRGRAAALTAAPHLSSLFHERGVNMRCLGAVRDGVGTGSRYSVRAAAAPLPPSPIRSHSLTPPLCPCCLSHCC